MTIQVTPYTSFGYDPTTQLYLPTKVGPRQIDPISNEEYALLRSGGDYTVLTNLSAGALNADLVPATDISAYKSCSIHIGPSAYVGTLAVQVSNDNINWGTFALVDNTGSNFIGTITSLSNVVYYGALYTNFIRIRMTSYTSGVAQGAFFLSTFPSTPNASGVRQLGTWIVQPGNTPNTTPWLVARNNNNFVQVAGGALTVGKASAGWLDSGMVTATGTVGLTVYDNASTASGTPLLVIPANPTVGTRFPVEGWAKNGITSGGVANCPGVTFFYA